MEYNDQKEVVKDLKTIAKFIRIAKTMMDNVKNQIAEDDDHSALVEKLDANIKVLDTISDRWNDGIIEEFKTEQLMPGCQLKLF